MGFRRSEVRILSPRHAKGSGESRGLLFFPLSPKAFRSSWGPSPASQRDGTSSSYPRSQQVARSVAAPESSPFRPPASSPACPLHLGTTSAAAVVLVLPGDHG